MAIFHLTTKIHGLSGDPKLNALRSYAYRSGTKVIDPVSNRIYNFRSKQAEVVLTETMVPSGSLPDWMKDGVQLWRAVQTIEEAVRPNSHDSQIYREIEASLPIELGSDEWTQIIRDFINEQILPKGMICSFSIHNKESNPHFHLMATLREIQGNKFGRKNRDWNKVSFVRELRESWSRHVNAALEKAGLNQRITHKSFADLGIEREATVHVGPQHLGDRDVAYQAKREARSQKNDRVRLSNSGRGKQRRQNARTYLAAGVCAAKLSVALHNQESMPSLFAEQFSPPKPTLSREDQLACDAMRQWFPDADQVFIELGRVKRALGREWTWAGFQRQYRRLDQFADVFDSMLAKDLIWVVSRAPELVPEFMAAVPSRRLPKAVERANAWAAASQPDKVALLAEMMASMAGALNAAPSDTEIDAYVAALAPVEYLITNKVEFIRQCQSVAMAIDRPLTPEVLSKRLERVLAGARRPQCHSELLDALITMEVVFTAKRRPHKMADVLREVPTECRSHFEGVIASVLGKLPVDAGHDMAASALSHQARMDMQAEFNVRQVLSEFQLSDFDRRRQALAALGKTYSWSDFQQDIQRHCGMDAGWQRAWWDEQIDSLAGTPLASFLKTLPSWYARSAPSKPIAYPLGAYDPEPKKTLLARLEAHRELHPTMVVADANDTRTRPHEADLGDARHGAVMPPAPILEGKTSNPWGGAANHLGGRNLRGSETPYPNGW